MQRIGQPPKETKSGLPRVRCVRILLFGTCIGNVPQCYALDGGINRKNIELFEPKQAAMSLCVGGEKLFSKLLLVAEH